MVHIVSSSFLKFTAVFCSYKKNADRRILLTTICTVKPLPSSALQKRCDTPTWEFDLHRHIPAIICDTPLCNISCDTCAIPHENKHKVSKYNRKALCDMKSITAGPLRISKSQGGIETDGFQNHKTLECLTNKAGIWVHVCFGALLGVSFKTARKGVSKDSSGWVSKWQAFVF